MRLEETRDALFRALPRYDYRGLLGQGGMAVAFRAYDRDLEHEIALKVQLSGDEVGEEELLLRMKREVTLNRRIKHPNVAQMFDFGVAADLAYITMEFVPGKNLAHLLAAEGPLSPSRLVPLIAQVVDGTGAAHRAGITHRDLKPANIMITPDGTVVILDFGLARRPVDASITGGGVVVGTLPYMAPEQLTDFRSDARTDLYAIGVIAHEALTGALPHRGKSPATLAASITQHRVPRDALVAAGVPPALAAVVLRCLERDPADRYQTAEALGLDLAALGSGAPDPVARTAQGPGTAVERSETARLTRPVTPSAGGPASSGPPTTRSRPVVLVVDGDATTRREACATLSRSGCEVLQTGTAAEALDLLLRRNVDLVLMDVALPAIDGFDALRILRSQPGRSSVPVLLMSTVVDPSRVAFAHQAGARDLLGKPVPTLELVNRTWEALRQEGFPRPPRPLS